MCAVFAGCLTGRRDWPLRGRAGSAAAAGRGPRPCGACAWSSRGGCAAAALSLPRGARGLHAPFGGFNRAQAAVIEGAILVSRLDLLPREKIEREIAYLEIAVGKTAGPAEREAWDWLTEAVRAHYLSADDAD